MFFRRSQRKKYAVCNLKGKYTEEITIKILKPNCSLVDCIESSPIIFHTIHLGTVKFEICCRYGLQFELTERYLLWFRANNSLDSVSRLIGNIFTTIYTIS